MQGTRREVRSIYPAEISGAYAATRSDRIDLTIGGLDSQVGIPK